MESMENTESKKQYQGPHSGNLLLNEVPVALRDYTLDIDKYMAKYPAFLKIIGNVSLRRYMWDIFSAITAMFIEEYTVKQYGDYPKDAMTSWTADDCLKQIQKYASRFKSNARGDNEVLQDLLKIAHYASLAYLKMRNYETLVVPPVITKEGDPIMPVSEETIEVSSEEEDD